MCLFFSFHSHGLTLEPYYGLLSNSKTTYTYEGTQATTFPDVYTDKMKGSGYGLKASMNFYSLFFGGDYMWTKGKLKVDPDVSGAEGRFKAKNLYAVAGFGQPGGLRVWYAHGLSGDFEREDGSTLTKFKGDSFKVGLCIGLSYLSLNAEYFKWKFKKYEQGSQSGGVQDIYKKIDADGFLISVSVPLTF